jgi:hypothetical protein
MNTQTMLTREHVQKFFAASYQELSSLLRQRQCPQPVKPHAGEPDILWWADEIEDSRSDVAQTLERWRRNRRVAA